MWNPRSACRSPEAFGTVPGIEQDMRHGPTTGSKVRMMPPSSRSCWRRARLPLRRPFAVDTIAEPVGSAAPRAHTDSAPYYDPGCVCPPSSNDAAPALPSSCPWACASSSRRGLHTLSRRVAWHGLDAWVALGVVRLQFCCHLRLHRLAKVPREGVLPRLWLPRALRRKAAQSCQARSRADLTQQAAQGAPTFTLHQPQQHDHEVLVLGLGEKLAELFGQSDDMFSSKHIMGTGIGHLHGLKGFYSSL